MKRLRVSLLALAAAGALMSSASLSAQEWRGGKARVEGSVKNEKGEPIEGCKVSLRWGKSGHGGPDLTTDNKGRWAVMGLSGGPWDIDFEAPGYLTKQISAELQEGARNPPINVQLEPQPKAQAREEILVGGKKVSKETAAAIEAGNEAMSAKSYAAARESYSKALQELPDNASLLQHIAAAYLGEGNLDQAVKFARQAVEKDPQDVAAWRMIAEIELERGNLDAGRAALEKVPPEKITDPQPYLNIGILLLNKKKPAEAEPALDKAITVKPDLAEAYYYRGLARLQQKKNADAKADLQKALELAPDSPDAKDIKDLLKTIP
ncbi:MAG TPA: tetratricopeptide repeat protein [Thermoanaerobaculia bacterium]|jgi:tetratricopeptide (TPR) repeat protein